MHRTDADGFALGHLFQEGAPGTGLLASRVGAKWLQNLQEEFVSPVEAAGLTLDDEDNGQLLEAFSLLLSAGNAAAVLKNRLINGGFRLWQRGASVPVGTSNVFTADRWAANAGPTGTGAATVSRQNFTPGQTDIPDGPKHFLRWVQTTNAGSAPVLFQPIEDVARYSSGEFTVSFWARASTNLNAATKCTQIFGTGGSAAFGVGTQAIALTTTWQKFTASYTLPSVAGKTIGPQNYLRVGLTLPPSATYTIEVADFQFEPGESGSAFDRRPEQVEYLLAARYFEKTYALDTTPGTLTRAGALHQRAGSNSSGPSELFNLQERFRVVKRAPPTVTWYAPSGDVAPWDPGIGKISSYRSPYPWTEVAIPVVATTGTTDEWTGHPRRGDVSAGAPENYNVAGSISWAHWTADAELL